MDIRKHTGLDHYAPDRHSTVTDAARWLRERRGELAGRLNRRWPDYASVLREMAADGITTGGGVPPKKLTVDAIRKMWRRIFMEEWSIAQRAGLPPPPLSDADR